MGILYQEKKNIGYWLQAFGLLQKEGLFYVFNKFYIFNQITTT